MVQILERNNESFAINNGTLLQDSTLFHYKIEQIDKLIDMAAWKANELWVTASGISNNVNKYREYLNEVSSFIKNVWCELRDHATHNQDWDLIPESQKRSDRSVIQWKPAPRHQYYWNEVEWRHEAS
jgi:hypothetical protein